MPIYDIIIYEDMSKGVTYMDIAGLSTALSNVNTMSQVSTAVLSKALDTQEAQGQSLIAMMDRSMELSVNPNIGSNFDMTV